MSGDPLKDANHDDELNEPARRTGIAPEEWMLGFLKKYVETSVERDRDIPKTAMVEELNGGTCHVICSQGVRQHIINTVIVEAANPHELTRLTEVMLVSENHITFNGTFADVAIVLRRMGITALRA